MTLENFKSTLKEAPETIDFKETMKVISSLYNYTPTAFVNGTLKSDATQNQGSCKIFAFAIVEKLSKEEALACFGQYYFTDVLKNLEGTDHQNIRNFMKTGFEGLTFNNQVLIEK